MPLIFGIFTIVFAVTLLARKFWCYNITKCCVLPKKNIEKAKAPGAPPEFRQISILRQHTKYTHYKSIPKCEYVNLSLCCCSQTLRASATCNLTTVRLTLNVAYMLIRFLCNPGSGELSIYFSTLTPTKSFFRLRIRLRLPVKTFDFLDYDSRLRLSDTSNDHILTTVYHGIKPLKILKVKNL